MSLLLDICRNAFACHYQQNTFPGDSDPCGKCANCLADAALGKEWRNASAAPPAASPCSECGHVHQHPNICSAPYGIDSRCVCKAPPTASPQIPGPLVKEMRDLIGELEAASPQPAECPMCCKPIIESRPDAKALAERIAKRLCSEYHIRERGAAAIVEQELTR